MNIPNGLIDAYVAPSHIAPTLYPDEGYPFRTNPQITRPAKPAYPCTATVSYTHLTLPTKA